MAYRKGGPIVAFSPSFIPFWAMFHLVMILVRLVDWFFYRIRIRGRQTLRECARAILVSNHTLILDPAVIAHSLGRRRTYFTMLEETALIPWLGTFVRLLGALPIPEGVGSMLALETAARRAVAEMDLLHFFPEGECYRWNQDIQPFRPGAFLLACRLGLPVIPMTTVLHERRWRGLRSVRVAGRTIPIPPLVTVVFGRPVQPPRALEGAHPRVVRGVALRMAAEVRQAMQDTVDALGGSREIYRGKMPRLMKRPPEARPGQGERSAARAI